MRGIGKDFSLIDKLFSKLNLEKVTKIEEQQGTIYPVYFVTTSEKKYIVVRYPKEDVTKADISEQLKQLDALIYINDNGVHCTLPIEFSDNYFICYKNNYFLIYNDFGYKKVSRKNLDKKKIKKLATNQAIIHNLNYKIDIPCPYEKIKINLRRTTLKMEHINKELYYLLYDNIYNLEELIKKYNNCLKYAMNKLCLSYDNYNLSEIVWEKDFMYLNEHRNCFMSNPTVSLAEAAYNICKAGRYIDLEAYKLYLRNYIKKINSLDYDYKDALYVGMNKYLLYLQELLKECLKRDQETITEAIKILKEIVFYYEHIDDMYAAYIEAVKKEKKE